MIIIKADRMNSPEQNKTVRLLKTKGRRSSSGSGSSYGSGTSLVGSPRPVGGRKSKSNRPTKGKQLKVLDEDGSDVTPQPLSQTDPEAPKRTMFFLDEGSDSETELGKTDSPTLLCSFTTTTFNVDNAATTQYTTKGSITSDHEESLSSSEMQRPQRFQLEEAERVEAVTEEMLEESVDICLTETETISLLYLPGRVLPEDAEDAAAQKERNRCYLELCKGKPGNDKFVERSMQTFDDAPKSKRIQTDTVATVDTGTMATNWDIYDSFNELDISTAVSESDNIESLMRTVSQGSKEHSKSSSTTGSTISSLPDIDMNGDGSQNSPDLQTVMQSKEFQHSLLIMERNVVANIFQSTLAAYRELPILQDPYRPEEHKVDIPKKPKDHPHPKVPPEKEALVSPALNHLWSFSCDLTQGCEVTCMGWHKESPDILAVGYNNSANTVKPGLICVWSLKSPTWPERVLYTDSAVTSLDFSAHSPSQIGVGMMDGTVALYNVANRQCVADSSNSSKKHVQQVCMVQWSQQESESNREEQEEVLVSVSADALVKKWFISSKGLECTDLFQLRNITKNTKKEPVSTKKKSQNVQKGGAAPGLCFDFHPVNSSLYLAGTREGLIHMCSFSNRQYYLETYDKHICPVNNIEWSPFSPDVFLSCSSDWTVQLWRRDKRTPILGFTSSQSAVYTARWSPRWPTVFAALKEEQLEIWDLKSSILDPIIVLRSSAEVELTDLLFCKEADAVVLGDSEGGVKVYQVNNIRAGKDHQVVRLEDII